MINFNRYLLSNGLRVLHHRDDSTPMVAVSLAYDVGSRDEHPQKTGFAHLFEHLMFGGSVHIPDYDIPAQEAGAENNAWTSDDVTCYYIVIPKQNVETAFWLESDRMLSLSFTEKSLEVQKQVVMEEFKQRSLNQPYGDVPHLIRSLAYQVHPYHWPTIGKEIAHIEQATLEDVKTFFFRHYAPNNAVLSVAGNISFEDTIRLAEKWFGPVPEREISPRNLPREPLQFSPRLMEVERNVPVNAIYKAYHIPGRMDSDYPVCDLLSDLLAHGRSSRLFQHLVMEKQLFSEIDAHVSANSDPGLLYISGKPVQGVSLETADLAIQQELKQLCTVKAEERELEKVKNKFESNDLFSNLNYLNKATNLGLFEIMGDAGFINREVEKYRQVTAGDVLRVAGSVLDEKNSSTLYYWGK